MSKIISDSIFNTYTQNPEVAILMSGKGSNAATLLSDSEISELYKVQLIVSDNPLSSAEELAQRFGVKPSVMPAEKFQDNLARQRYFDHLANFLGQIGIKAIFYCGFMKISTPEFCAEFPGVNVHPADLTIISDDGLPKYRGMRAMEDMLRDYGYVRSTVHAVDVPVDTGLSLGLSECVIAEDGISAYDLHNRLKLEEHKIFPATLKNIALGKVTKNSLPFRLTENQDGSSNDN